MKPIKTKSTNCTYAISQLPYLPLPAEKTPEGGVTSCWKLSLVERLQVFIFGKIHITVLTFNDPLQPIKPYVTK